MDRQQDLAKNMAKSGLECVQMCGVTVLPVMLAVLLAGCDNPESAISPKAVQGRYSGIGTFDVGALWAEQMDVPDPADPSAARIGDDEQIIVVIDTHTGEVRQCGNHSGYCISSNPWDDKAEPVRLKLHAEQLDASRNTASE